MTTYLAAKYLHITCVALSGTGFFLRGLLMLQEAPLANSRWLKVAPHVNDTILLAAALTLVVVTEQYPFIDTWVTAKGFGLIAYIILGSVALKMGKTKRVRVVAWLGALGVFGYLVSVALSKNPWGLFRMLGG